MPATPTLSIANNQDGTATVTVAGSDSGSTNTVYAARIDTTWDSDSLPSWVSKGSRSEDGTVDITLSGAVWFVYVASELSGATASTPPYAAFVTDSSQEAVLDQILEGVKAKVLALSLTGVDASDVVVVTTPDGQFAQTISDPMVLIAAGGSQQFSTEGDTGHYRLSWPVLVGMAVPANKDQTQAFRRQWFKNRERIENAIVYQRFALSAPYTCMLDPVLQAQNNLLDFSWWERNALAMPIVFRFTVDVPIGEL